MKNTIKKKTMSPTRRMARIPDAMERWTDRLVRVGAPLMLALSSLSILAVTWRAYELPRSALVPMGGLAAAALLYHWNRRQGAADR